MAETGSLPDAMVKTLMPTDFTVAPDEVGDRFTNRDDNANMTQLQSKFVSKEVYKLADNLYQDETLVKPYVGETSATTDMSDVIAAKGMNRKRAELEERAGGAGGGHDGRTLYEQIQANRDKKDEDWKAENNMFKPPPGLDEDELAYFEGIEAQNRKAFKMKQADKEATKLLFAQAQAERELAESAPRRAAPISIGKKPVFGGANAMKLPTKGQGRPSLLGGVFKKQKTEAPTVAAPPSSAIAASSTDSTGSTSGGEALAGLGGYGSGSASSSDSDSD